MQNVPVTMGNVQTVWREQEDVIVIKVGKELPVLWVRSLMRKCREGENNNTYSIVCLDQGWAII